MEIWNKRNAPVDRVLELGQEQKHWELASSYQHCWWTVSEATGEGTRMFFRNRFLLEQPRPYLPGKKIVN